MEPEQTILKHDGETASAFAAFTTYITLGPARTFQKVALTHGISERTVQRMAKKFDWSRRLAQIDQGLLFLHDQTSRQNVAEAADNRKVWDARADIVRTREWDISGKLIKTAEKIIHKFLSEDLDKATLTEAVRMISLASKLGRSATGTLDRNEFQQEDSHVLEHLDRVLDKIYSASRPNPNDKEIPTPTCPPQNQ